MGRSKKKTSEDEPQLNEELKGLNITINEFGEIQTNYDIDKLNKFLDENVEDKKLIEKEETEKKRKNEKK